MARVRYLVQAILIDGEIETVVDSRKSDSYRETVRSLMARHRHSYHYLYRAMNLESREIVLSTMENEFQ